MKIRNGFVSNSSSSSFVVINELVGELDKSAVIEDGALIVGKEGKLEFGCEVEKSCDFNSKLNFAYLQLLIIREYSKDKTNKYWNDILKKSFDLLDEVLKEEFGVDKIEYLITLWQHQNKGYEGYIDHQSTFYEDGNCFEMFENKRSLKNYLFNKESYIQTGDD